MLDSTLQKFKGSQGLYQINKMGNLEEMDKFLEKV